MHRSLATAAFAASAALLAACSNESRPAQQGRAVPYGPTAAAQAPRYSAPAAPAYAAPSTAYAPTRVAPPPPPSPYAAPAARAPVAMAPAPTASAGWRWHTRLADAQADARAQGKLILLSSTRPGCGLCEKFKHQVVPQQLGQLQTMAVGYSFDITAPEDSRADQVLRANLRGATLMPLCGFVTPDLQWVHGFWGPTDASKFGGDMATARRLYPVHASFVAPRSATAPTAPAIAKVNEYGEYEWSAAEEVAPEDAIGPDAGTPAPAAPTPVLAAAPAAPQATPELPPVAAVETVVAVETPAAAPIAEPVAAEAVATATPAEPTPPTAALPAPEVAQVPSAAAWSSPAGDAAASVTWSPTAASPAAASPAAASPAAASPAATAPAPGALYPGAAESPEAWGEAMLGKALEQIRGGDLEAARVTLTQVLARLPDSDLGLEAARGTVAVWSVRKIAKADETDRGVLSERARRDLGDTRWVALFP